jgi:hypothetical protein
MFIRNVDMCIKINTDQNPPKQHNHYYSFLLKTRVSYFSFHFQQVSVFAETSIARVTITGLPKLEFLVMNEQFIVYEIIRPTLATLSNVKCLQRLLFLPQTFFIGLSVSNPVSTSRASHVFHFIVTFLFLPEGVRTDNNILDIIEHYL